MSQRMDTAPVTRLVEPTTRYIHDLRCAAVCNCYSMDRHAPLDGRGPTPREFGGSAEKHMGAAVSTTSANGSGCPGQRPYHSSSVFGTTRRPAGSHVHGAHASEACCGRTQQERDGFDPMQVEWTPTTRRGPSTAGSSRASRLHRSTKRSRTSGDLPVRFWKQLGLLAGEDAGIVTALERNRPRRRRSRQPRSCRFLARDPFSGPSRPALSRAELVARGYQLRAIRRGEEATSTFRGRATYVVGRPARRFRDGLAFALSQLMCPFQKLRLSSA
jgi:hypothetical protein